MPRTTSNRFFYTQGSYTCSCCNAGKSHLFKPLIANFLFSHLFYTLTTCVMFIKDLGSGTIFFQKILLKKSSGSISARNCLLVHPFSIFLYFAIPLRGLFLLLFFELNHLLPGTSKAQSTHLLLLLDTKTVWKAYLIFGAKYANLLHSLSSFNKNK